MRKMAKTQMIIKIKTRRSLPENDAKNVDDEYDQEHNKEVDKDEEVYICHKTAISAKDKIFL